MQFPIWGLPRELGLKGAVFADAGTLFGYKGPNFFDVNGDYLISGFAPATGCVVTAALTVIPECVSVLDSHKIRSSVGASHAVELAARPDPVRLRLRAVQGRGRHQPGQRR